MEEREILLDDIGLLIREKDSHEVVERVDDKERNRKDPEADQDAPVDFLAPCGKLISPRACSIVKQKSFCEHDKDDSQNKDKHNVLKVEKSVEQNCEKQKNSSHDFPYVFVCGKSSHVIWEEG